MISKYEFQARVLGVNKHRESIGQRPIEKEMSLSELEAQEFLMDKADDAKTVISFIDKHMAEDPDGCFTFETYEGKKFSSVIFSIDEGQQNRRVFQDGPEEDFDINLAEIKSIWFTVTKDYLHLEH